MDYGIQLGRRFRSLKLWFVIRYFGVNGLISRIREHLRIAKEFAIWIDKHPKFERMAPVPLSTICFRAHPQNQNVNLNEFNEKYFRPGFPARTCVQAARLPFGIRVEIDAIAHI